MDSNPHVIQAKIAKLREEMKATLDRSKQPAIREKIAEETEKLKALLGEHNG